MLFGFIAHLFGAKAQKLDFTKYPVYNGKDLGLSYSPKESLFRIWAPSATEVEIILYDENDGNKGLKRVSMNKQKDGVWMTDLKSDAKGKFYTFRVKINGEWKDEVPDPYAKAVGVNGKRAMVVDLKETNPEGWEKDKSPHLKIQPMPSFMNCM